MRKLALPVSPEFNTLGSEGLLEGIALKTININV